MKSKLGTRCSTPCKRMIIIIRDFSTHLNFSRWYSIYIHRPSGSWTHLAAEPIRRIFCTCPAEISRSQPSWWPVDPVGISGSDSSNRPTSPWLLICYGGNILYRWLLVGQVDGADPVTAIGFCLLHGNLRKRASHVPYHRKYNVIPNGNKVLPNRNIFVSWHVMTKYWWRCLALCSYGF